MVRWCRNGFSVAAILVFSVLVSACGGGGSTGPAPAGPLAAAAARNAPSTGDTAVRAQSIEVGVGPESATTALPTASGVSGSISLHAVNAPAGAKLELLAAPAATDVRSAAALACPPVPPIVINNPLPFPITIGLESFHVSLPCSVNGLLFGASVYQSKPLPATVVTTKLGNATGIGHTITFTPTISQLTFPAKTALTIAIAPETSTAFAPVPAIANVPISLTANAPSVPNSLALQFANVAGAALFQTACFLPGDPAGPGLAGVNVLGTPSFYCVLEPGQTGATTTFGTGAANSVQFTLGPNAKPDRSLVQLDGPPLFAGCTPVTSGQQCDSPAFAIPVYSKAIVSNDAEIEACVPTVENADCNGVAGNPKAPAATSVKHGKEFQLLFADDPTYRAANTFGGLTVQIVPTRNSPCSINIGDDDNGDAPPGYSDPTAPAGSTPTLADFVGIGPYAELDINAKWPGTCSINLTEDTGLKRTFAFTIPII